MKRTRNIDGHGLPFPVNIPPQSHPILGAIVIMLARLVMVLGFVGKAALFGSLGGIIVYTLISSGLVNPTHGESSRPFSFNEFVIFEGSLFALGVVGFLISSAGKKMLYFGRKLRSIEALTVLNHDQRRPVLLLRSFSDDHIDDPTFVGPIEWTQQRYEEGLSRALNKLGPVVCLGRPGEKLGEAGAARLYVDDKHWQEAIFYLLKKSRVAVIIVGDTESLHWEIETAIAHTQLTNILFFFPYVEHTHIVRSHYQRLLQRLFPVNIPRKIYLQMEEERQRRYRMFCERFGVFFDRDLPSKLDEEQFLEFTIEGEALLVKTKRPILSAIATLVQKQFKMHINFSRTLGEFILKQSVGDNKKMHLNKVE